MRNSHTPAPFDRLALLLPAFQPDARFLPLLHLLASCGFGAIFVVDDGSSPSHTPLFAEAAHLPGVRVLRHAVNCGKGRALKTGLEAILHAYPSFEGVVTADADGQHTPEDICRVAEALGDTSGRFVLGARTAAPSAPGSPSASTGGTPKVPLRSALGNALTRALFALLYSARVRDTQTGLRGFARELLPGLLRLPGERYEYEMAVLTHLCRQGILPFEVPIATVYLEGNRHSHFRPVLDSLRIYATLCGPLLRHRPLARLQARASRAH